MANVIGRKKIFPKNKMCIRHFVLSPNKIN